MPEICSVVATAASLCSPRNSVRSCSSTGRAFSCAPAGALLGAPLATGWPREGYATIPSASAAALSCCDVAACWVAARLPGPEAAGGAVIEGYATSPSASAAATSCCSLGPFWSSGAFPHSSTTSKVTPLVAGFRKAATQMAATSTGQMLPLMVSPCPVFSFTGAPCGLLTKRPGRTMVYGTPASRTLCSPFSLLSIMRQRKVLSMMRIGLRLCRSVTNSEEMRSTRCTPALVAASTAVLTPLWSTFPAEPKPPP
mmetsp:Transcript_20903/g.62917  ORF Transcript_20903/g.62917 Transcript_20903/m.62917 type:complete len:255 (-) Transcript_20903:462-1226(-)